MKDFAYSYNTVFLRPYMSSLSTRDHAKTDVLFGERKFKLPVIPANMQDVISFENAQWLASNNYFYIMHRFENTTPSFIGWAQEHVPFVSVSVGTKDLERELGGAIDKKQRVDYITIDVAHAHHALTKDAITFVRKHFPKAFLIAGNVATWDGASFLTALKVDAIKVGIGDGSICTTRHETGFHLPTLQSIHEIIENVGSAIPLIADGGARHFGDIAKALAFGATMVMSGGWFASCVDSPAALVNGHKIYRGSTSFEAKGHGRHVEGRIREIEPTITYAEQMLKIKEALQSSISYAGGDNLSAFRGVQHVRVFPSCSY